MNKDGWVARPSLRCFVVCGTENEIKIKSKEKASFAFWNILKFKGPPGQFMGFCVNPIQ